MRLQDPEYLRNQQYINSSKLNTRISIHDRFSTNPQGLHPWMFAQIAGEVPSAGADILEIGCGSGRFWQSLSREIPATWQVALTDFSPGMVTSAREANRFAGHHFGVADAARIPFPFDSFDAVFAHFMLYHVRDIPRVLGEIRRVLRPGGILFAATIGAGHMAELFELAASFRPAWRTNSSEAAFQLENGAAQLAPFFSKIERRDYPDSLRVDQAEPLAAYVISTTTFADHQVTEAQEREFIAFIEARIRENGPIRITKNSGVFLARKGDP